MKYFDVLLHGLLILAIAMALIITILITMYRPQTTYRAIDGVLVEVGIDHVLDTSRLTCNPEDYIKEKLTKPKLQI